MKPSTDWTGIPHTDRTAVPTSWRRVQQVLAIEATSASIRGAEVSGVFELSDARAPLSMHADGRIRVEVKCLWYGCKPPSSWMHLILPSRWRLVRRYSGSVVENISQPTHAEPA